MFQNDAQSKLHETLREWFRNAIEQKLVVALTEYPAFVIERDGAPIEIRVEHCPPAMAAVSIETTRMVNGPFDPRAAWILLDRNFARAPCTVGADASRGHIVCRHWILGSAVTPETLNFGIDAVAAGMRETVLELERWFEAGLPLTAPKEAVAAAPEASGGVAVTAPEQAPPPDPTAAPAAP